MSQQYIFIVTRKSSMVASKIVATESVFVVKLIPSRSTLNNNLQATLKIQYFQNSYCYCYFVIIIGRINADTILSYCRLREITLMLLSCREIHTSLSTCCNIL